MKKIAINSLVGLFYFVVQTIIEMLVIPILIYSGIPYFGMGADDFLQVMAGVIVYFGLSKMLYLSVLYLALFALFSTATQINFRLLNALLSVFLYLSSALYFGRNILTMINPIISIIISCIIVYYLFKSVRLMNRVKKHSSGLKA